MWLLNVMKKIKGEKNRNTFNEGETERDEKAIKYLVRIESFQQVWLHAFKRCTGKGFFLICKKK